jgi:deoxyribodipyrimidine photo-lyase
MAASSSPVAIWWIRRDLRVHDNPALGAAVANGGRVLPLFILDPHLTHHTHVDARRRQAFLARGLWALDGELRARGSRLVVRSGRPAEVLVRLVAETGANVVTAEADVTPYGRRRDDEVSRVVPLQTTPGVTVQPPTAHRTKSGSPYVVFTPFKRAWLAADLPGEADVLAAPARLPPPPDLASDPIPVADALAEFRPCRRIFASACSRRDSPP